MKMTKTIGDYDVTVHELNLGDINQAIDIYDSVKQNGDNPFDMEKLKDHRQTIMAMINGKFDILLQEGSVNIKDLGFSELEQLVPMFLEVNKSFLERLPARLGIALEVDVENLIKTWLNV